MYVLYTIQFHNKTYEMRLLKKIFFLSFKSCKVMLTVLALTFG